MDKTTLSKYGWVVVVAVVVSILVFSAPLLGERISGNTVSVVEKNLDAHNVTLHPNGGTVQYNDVLVVTGKEYGYLPTPTCPGQTFVGWYTEAVGGTKITSQTVYHGANDHALYAHWQPATP